LIEEKAIVLSSADGIAQVETQRYSTCGGCSVQAGCGTDMLARVFGNRRNRLSVLNPVDAKPGDRVIIGFDEHTLVKASLIVYLVPLLSLILGAVTGQLGAQRMDLASPELAGIFGGFTGLLAGLFWVWLKTRYVQTDTRYRAVILRAVNQVFAGQPRSDVLFTSTGKQ